MPSFQSILKQLACLNLGLSLLAWSNLGILIAVHSLAFSPCGQFLVSASYDKSIKLFDAKTQKCLHKFPDHSGVVLSVAFSPCGSLLASGILRTSLSSSLMCNPAAVSILFLSILILFIPWLLALAALSSPLVHPTSLSSSLMCYPAAVSILFLSILVLLIPVAFSPCGQFLASGSSDNSIKLFDVKSRTCIHYFF